MGKKKVSEALKGVLANVEALTEDDLKQIADVADQRIRLFRKKREEEEEKKEEEAREKAEQERRDTENERKRRFVRYLQTAKFRKWREETQALFDGLSNFEQKSLSIKLNIPVEISTTASCEEASDPEEIFDNDHVFPNLRFGVEGTDVQLHVAKDGLTKRQRDTLQQGIDEIKDDWCSVIMDIFDEDRKEINKLEAKGKRLLEEYNESLIKNEDYNDLFENVGDVLDPESLIARLEQEIEGNEGT